MLKQSVLISYIKLQELELDNFSQGVYNSLKGNTNFTLETTVLPQLQTNILAYRSKLEVSVSGSSKDIVAKNNIKTILLDQLRTIAIDINRQANNDLVKLQSSGFKLAKKSTKKGVLPKPTGFNVKTGANSGELLFTTDANKDANMYYFYSVQVPAPIDINSWRLIPSTTRKKNVSGYVPGKQYELKCAYKGTEDTLIYSESILLFAQ